jgi:hypothetical protein
LQHEAAVDDSRTAAALDATLLATAATCNVQILLPCVSSVGLLNAQLTQAFFDMLPSLTFGLDASVRNLWTVFAPALTLSALNNFNDSAVLLPGFARISTSIPHGSKMGAAIQATLLACGAVEACVAFLQHHLSGLLDVEEKVRLEKVQRLTALPPVLQILTGLVCVVSAVVFFQICLACWCSPNFARSLVLCPLRHD